MAVNSRRSLTTPRPSPPPDRSPITGAGGGGPYFGPYADQPVAPSPTKQVAPLAPAPSPHKGAGMAPAPAPMKSAPAPAPALAPKPVPV